MASEDASSPVASGSMCLPPLRERKTEDDRAERVKPEMFELSGAVRTGG